MTPVSHADDWPEIDGISPANVRDQIGGKARLFLVLLRKLVEDYADLREPASQPTETLAALGSRMHKLKGAAGTLGATAIFELAAAAERAAAAADCDGFGRLAAALAAELAVLEGRVANAEEAARSKAPEDFPPADRPGRADLDDLARLLRGQHLMALSRFEAMRRPLIGQFGADRVSVLRDHIDNLRFAAAADLLETCRREASSR